MELRSISGILCATDLSPESSKAVEFAASLASQIKGSHLIILSVVKPIPAYSQEVAADPEIIESENQIKSEREYQIKKIAENIRSEGVGDVKTLVTIGDPVEEILRISREESADLIVLGNRKRGFARGIFFGSVSERVASSSSCSVLIVR